MKTNWQTKSFGDCLDKVIYTNKIQKNKFLESGEFPIVSQEKSLISGYWNNEKDLFRLSKPITIFGDHTQIVKYIDFDFVLGADGVKLLQPKDFLYTKFLYYFLRNINLKNLGYARHYRLLKNKKVSFPSIFEQKRIVGILDGVFEGVEKAKENAEKNLANTKELFESYLQSIFENPGKDWEEKLLSEVCSIKSKLIDPRKKDFLSLVHVGAGNIKSNTGELVKLKTPEEEGLISGKFLFDDSMILYSKIRPYLRKVVRPNFDGLCSADIYPLSPNTVNMNRDFLYYIFLSKEFTSYAIKGSGRAGMPKVNRKYLFTYKTQIPPLTTQKQIVKKLDGLSAQTKKLEEIYLQKIMDLEELKKSILKKAFSGKM